MLQDRLPAALVTVRPSLSRLCQTSSGESADHDLMLVDRFKRGEEDAFVEIKKRHEKKLFHIAYRFLRDQQDAEEIVQDSLLRAHRSLKHFRGDSPLSSWLYRVVSNLASNRYWHRKRRGAGRTLSLDYEFQGGDTFLVMFADEGLNPAQIVSLHEFASLISRCMEELLPEERELLISWSERDLSYGKIAVKQDISMGTVKSQIARARNRLADLATEAYSNDNGHGVGERALRTACPAPPHRQSRTRISPLIALRTHR